MSRIRPSRRTVLAGTSAFGSLAVLGCLGTGGDDRNDTDSADDGSGSDGDGRSLREESPLELVEPDAPVGSGLAPSNERITNVHGHGDHSHWHFEPILVPHGDERTVRIRYLDEDVEPLPLGDGEPFQTTVDLVDSSPSGFLATSVDDDLVTFTGESTGDGSLRFELWRDDDRLWESPLLAIEVGDEADRIDARNR